MGINNVENIFCIRLADIFSTIYFVCFLFSAVNMIFDSIDDLRCLENISYEDEYTMNTLFEDKQLQALLEVRFVYMCINCNLELSYPVIQI